MPIITKQFTLSVTPEKFLDSCSDFELYELSLLLDSNKFQKRLVKFHRAAAPRRIEGTNINIHGGNE